MYLDLQEKLLWEEDGNEDNVAEVHQRGGDVNPYLTNQQQECISMGERKTCEAPFKGLKNGTSAPSSRGGGGANMQCACKAMH
jgi:hypothetical protein